MEFTGKLKRMDRRHFKWFVGKGKAGSMSICLVMPSRATLNFRHWFVQSCKFMLVILGFPRAKETNGVLYQAKVLPNMGGNSRAYWYYKVNSVRNRLVCICFVTKPTELSVWWKITCICPFWSYISGTWIKHATGVGALSKTCSKGKLSISSLHSDIWSFCTLTDPPGRNYEDGLRKLCFEIHQCRQEQLRTFKVKLTSILYRLKLFSLDLFQHTVNQLAWTEHHSWKRRYNFLNSVASLKKIKVSLIDHVFYSAPLNLVSFYHIFILKYKYLFVNDSLVIIKFVNTWEKLLTYYGEANDLLKVIK